MSLPTLKQNGKKAIDTFLHETVQSRSVPAVFFGATNAKEEIYFSCEGDKVFGEPDKGHVNPDTTMQMFSMTKFVTTIACLQQIEKGLLSLDDPLVVEKYCPELCAQPILVGYEDDGKEILRKRENPLTLKILLTHTSGLAYTWNSPLIDRWRTEHQVLSRYAPGPPLSSFIQPLVFEPGTRHKYSTGIDWAGILVSRAAETELEALFQETIFKPCGMTSTSFKPTPEIMDRMMSMTVRVPSHTGEIQLRESSMGERSSDAKEYGPLYIGGGGLFGTARDYLSLLRHVLASADPATETPLISRESFDLLFTDVLPKTPEIRQDMAEMALKQNVHDPNILDEGKGTGIGHSPGLFLNLLQSKWGRREGSGFWDGAAKTAFWLDPKTGLGAVCCTNLTADNPDPWNGVFNQYERLLYNNLE